MSACRVKHALYVDERTVAAGAQMRFANDAAEIESGRASSAFIRTLSLSAPAGEIEHFILHSILNPLLQTDNAEPAITLHRVADARVFPGIETEVGAAQQWRRRNRVLNRCSALDFDGSADGKPKREGPSQCS